MAVELESHVSGALYFPKYGKALVASKSTGACAKCYSGVVPYREPNAVALMRTRIRRRIQLDANYVKHTIVPNVVSLHHFGGQSPLVRSSCWRERPVHQPLALPPLAARINNFSFSSRDEIATRYPLPANMAPSYFTPTREWPLVKREGGVPVRTEVR